MYRNRGVLCGQPHQTEAYPEFNARLATCIVVVQVLSQAILLEAHLTRRERYETRAILRPKKMFFLFSTLAVVLNLPLVDEDITTILSSTVNPSK